MNKIIKPNISVILTYYNRPKMAKRAISKILNQTVSNFELIIVDDCSKKLLNFDKLFLKKNKITYLRNKQNIGSNRSRLKGLRVAKGNYICFHDDDDYWMRKKLENQYKFLKQNHDIYIVSSYAKNKKNNIIKFPLKPSNTSLSIYNCLGSFSIPMIRKNKILFTSLSNNLKNSQDWNVWRKISKVYPVATIPKTLVYINDGSHERITLQQNREKYYKSYLKVALSDNRNKIIRYYHRSLYNYHCSDKNLKKIFYGFFVFFLRMYTKIILFFDK